MVDLIRRRLIDEALNYDKHINAAVFDIEKKQVAKYTENLLPTEGVLSNAELMTNLGAALNAFILLLERKRAELVHLRAQNDARQFTQSVTELAKVQEVIQGYNAAISFATGSKVSAPAGPLVDSVRKALPYASELARGCLERLRLFMDPRMNAEAARTLLPLFVDAYACYDLIRDQLSTGNLKELTSDDLNARIDQLFRDTAGLAQRFRDLNIPGPNRHNFAPGGGGGPGGGPGGGGPGGGPGGGGPGGGRGGGLPGGGGGGLPGGGGGLPGGGGGLPGGGDGGGGDGGGGGGGGDRFAPFMRPAAPDGGGGPAAADVPQHLPQEAQPMEVHGGVPAAAAIPPASPFEPRVPFLRTTDMRPGSSDDHLRPAAPAPAAAARFYIGEPIVVDPEPGPGPGAGAASTAIATLGHGAQQFMQRAQNFAHHFLPLMRRAAASGLEVIPIQVGGINLGDIPVQVLNRFVHNPQELVGGLAAMWVFAQAPAFQLLNTGDALFQPWAL